MNSADRPLCPEKNFVLVGPELGNTGKDTSTILFIVPEVK